MKKDSKQRLFEMMGKVDTSFKKKLNENYYDAVDSGMNQYAADNVDFGDDTNNKNYGDPTKEDMVNHLQNKFKGLADGEEDMKFAIETAIYWYAHDYHNGQHSNLYSALSTSQYKPSPMERSIKDTDNYLAIQMYDDLETQIGLSKNMNEMNSVADDKYNQNIGHERKRATINDVSSEQRNAIYRVVNEYVRKNSNFINDVMQNVGDVQDNDEYLKIVSIASDELGNALAREYFESQG